MENVTLQCNKISTRKTIIAALASMAILIFAQTAAELLASLLVVLSVPEGACNIVAGVLYLLIAYVMLRFLVKKILKYPMNDMGMPKFRVKIKYIVVALILPVTVMATYLLVFDGKYVTQDISKSHAFEILGAGIFFTGIACGFVEEMVFRGVILNLLKKRWNDKIAVIVPSVLFGVVHILGMNYSIASCLLVIVAGTMVGIMFSVIAIESGSVWNSAIVHVIWNIVIVGGGLSVSEKPQEDALMTYVLDNKSFAFTGGEFGIESSVIAVIGYIIVIGVVCATASCVRAKKLRARI